MLGIFCTDMVGDGKQVRLIRDFFGKMIEKLRRNSVTYYRKSLILVVLPRFTRNKFYVIEKFLKFGFIIRRC